MVRRLNSSDFSVESANNIKPFHKADKRQLGLRVRKEFAEALKVQGIFKQKPAEVVLDEILKQHFSQDPETVSYFEKAQQILAIKQDD